VQAAQLQHDEEQEEDDGAAGVQQVLPLLPEAHGAQRDEVGQSGELRIGNLRIGFGDWALGHWNGSLEQSEHASFQYSNCKFQITR
jgi:hypothetical protein